MKTPTFWYDTTKKPNPFQGLLLAPATAAYRLGARLRKALAKPFRAEKPVLCVGNVVAGGAGKTPTCIALARLMRHEGATPVFVSRGYGGLEKGPILVDPAHHTAKDVGDEALLLAKRAPCWIGKDKVATLRAAEASGSHIIMDDGFQNPTIAPHVGLLVIDGASGLGNGKTIPSGPLRETLDEALARTTAVIMIGKDEHNLTRLITKPVFEARLRPHIPDDFPDLRPYYAFAGIGRPDKFFASCAEVGLKLRERRAFPDHHLYTEDEIAALAQEADQKGLQLLTTTKDWVRLPEAFKPKVAALQVEITFRDPMGLLNIIQSALTK